MPTPFTHLEIAQRLLEDEAVSADIRNFLKAERGAFLLGSVAADARADGITRADTHFYAYGVPLTEAPWQRMLDSNPALQSPHSRTQKAFVAGYIAHLCVDEIWTVQMLGPHFALGDWATRAFRFFMLHILLIFMDERDLAQLEGWQYEALISAQPDSWLPFMPDTLLCTWRDFIGQQIRPGGVSETLEVFGERINRTPEEMRAVLDSPERMQADLWAHIPAETLQTIETAMYTHARVQMCAYFE